MTINLPIANQFVKSGVVGQDFYNDANLTQNQQKMLLYSLADREADIEPYVSYPKENMDYDIELVSMKEDFKDVRNMTDPPDKSENMSVVINGALVVLGVIIIVKILS
jgi:hypothetical protein